MLIPGARTFHLVSFRGGCQGAACSIESLGFRASGAVRFRAPARISNVLEDRCGLSYSDGLECRCRQLYEAVVPDDLDSDEDARLRGSRDRGKFCLTILSVVVAFISLIVNKRRAA